MSFFVIAYSLVLVGVFSFSFAYMANLRSVLISPSQNQTLCHPNGSFMINLGRPNVDGSEEDLFLWLIIIPNLLPLKHGLL